MVILIIILIGQAGDLIVNIDHNTKQETTRKIKVLETDKTDSVAIKKEEVIEPISALLMNGSLESGQKIFKKCGSCHNIKKGSANKVGPNLWNIINRPVANVEGFSYSKALIENGGKWNYEELAKFLYKPKLYAKGTKMNFSGLKKVQDRANLVLFLRENSDNPVPLP